jgi:FHA domain
VDATERALNRLRDAYGAGQVSTDTLELRTALALTGRVDDAVWDLPRRWFTRAAPVRSLVAGRHEWPLADRGRWVLGRGLECDILLGGDDAISRRHAELAVRAGVCLIRDLDSCNGTLLNGRFVERARVTRGDIVVIGETELRVR